MAVVGLKYFAAAPLATEVDGSMPTYSAGAKIGHLMKADISWSTGDVGLYGDNVEVEHDNTKSYGTLTMGTTYLSIDGRKMLLGEEEFGTPGTGDPQVYATSDTPAPYVGVGYVTHDSADGGDPVYIAWWVFKVQFSMDESHETRQENTAYQTPELTGRVMGVRPDESLKNRFRIYAEFEDEADAIDWVKAKAGISA